MSVQITSRLATSKTAGRQKRVSDAMSTLSTTVFGSNASPEFGCCRAIHPAKHSGRSQYGCWVKLFRHITSAAFKKKLAEASDLTSEALQIDVDEKRSHDLVWRKRGTVLSRIRQVLRDIDTDVSAIVESRDEPEPTPIRAAAFRVTSR